MKFVDDDDDDDLLINNDRVSNIKIVSKCEAVRYFDDNSIIMTVMIVPKAGMVQSISGWMRGVQVKL